jgi:hypothetical protein
MFLSAIYGPLHTYFDPNIWYHDDELRKQVEQFIGCIVLTAQEAPKTPRKLRDDLYKKRWAGIRSPGANHMAS